MLVQQAAAETSLWNRTQFGSLSLSFSLWRPGKVLNIRQCRPDTWKCQRMRRRRSRRRRARQGRGKGLDCRRSWVALGEGFVQAQLKVVLSGQLQLGKTGAGMGHIMRVLRLPSAQVLLPKQMLLITPLIMMITLMMMMGMGMMMMLLPLCTGLAFSLRSHHPLRVAL